MRAECYKPTIRGLLKLWAPGILGPQASRLHRYVSGAVVSSRRDACGPRIVTS